MTTHLNASVVVDLQTGLNFVLWMIRRRRGTYIAELLLAPVGGEKRVAELCFAVRQVEERRSAADRPSPLLIKAWRYANFPVIIRLLTCRYIHQIIGHSCQFDAQ